MAQHKGRTSLVVAGVGFGVAAGVALGALVLAPNIPGGGESAASLVAQRDQANQEAEINKAQSQTADAFVEGVSDTAVRGTLDKRPVLIMRAPGVEDDDAKAVEELLKQAGATNSGTLNLTESFFSQQGADGLKSIVANTLPAGAQLSVDKLDAGTHAGEALGSALLLNPENGEELANSSDRDLILKALAQAGYLEYQQGTILPAQAVVLLVGQTDGFSAQSEAAFAEALKSRGAATVVAGEIHTASEGGPVDAVREQRGSEVSTVDSLSRAWGRIATVLAVREQLDGGHGHYGAAASATAPAPALRSASAPSEAPPQAGDNAAQPNSDQPGSNQQGSDAAPVSAAQGASE